LSIRVRNQRVHRASHLFNLGPGQRPVLATYLYLRFK